MAAEDGRREVRERFPGAGSRLGEEDAAPAEDARDSRGHVPLPGPRLELGDGSRERAILREDALDERV
jgi:hypothetical protein